MKGTPEQRFWAKVDKTDGPDSCWLWTRATVKGYGSFRLARGSVYAHRFSWELVNGPIPAGLQLDHRPTCPKRCVRPSHLRLATIKQNHENLTGANRNSKSGVRGVSWHKTGRKWRVAVKHNNKQIHGGYFTTIEEADEAAKALRRKLFTHNDMDVQYLNTTTTREGE